MGVRIKSEDPVPQIASTQRTELLPRCLAQPTAPTSDEMLADFLGLYEDDDTDSSTDSDDDDEDEDMDLDDAAPAPQVKLPVRSGLKIILPARKNVSSGGALDIAPHGVSDVSDVHTHKTLDDGYDVDESESDSSMDEDAKEGDDFMDLDADGDDDDEQEVEYDAEEEDDDPTPYVPIIIHRRAGRARSPLSACGRYGAFPVYAAFRCTIHGCDFTASSAQHLRHHMSTASHSRQWRLGGQMSG